MTGTKKTEEKIHKPPKEHTVVDDSEITFEKDPYKYGQKIARVAVREAYIKTLRKFRDAKKP